MIALENVSKSFNNKLAVDRVSFDVAEGETLILLGISGCGKTTTLRMINRLLDPDTGIIYVNGKDVKKQRAENLRRSIGYVLQNSGLFPHFTVAENIAIVPKLLSWNKKNIEERSLQLIEKLHLKKELLSAYPSELSGGQQQRVGLARALMANPSVLLMDEPFGALDPITRISIRKEFNNLDELKRKTIIMVTHDVTEAFELGDRICLMNEGRVIQIGTPAELLFKPKIEFVKAFLEEQKLQLEFKALKISDLWTPLPSHNTMLSETDLSIKASLWDAMTLFMSGRQKITVVDENTDEIKEIDLVQVMSLVKSFKGNT